MLSCMHKRLEQKEKESLPSAESCAIDPSIRSCSSPLPAAAAIFIARERYINVLSCIRVLQSHSTRAQPLVVAIPFAKPAMSCLDCLSPHAPCPDRIGELGLAVRDEVWRLVLKSLDSRCSGLGLVRTGDAGSQYPFWPEYRIRCTSAFWFLSR